MKQKIKTLITGGAGFIGLHLANYLLDKGEEVVIVDNFFRGKDNREFQKTLKRINSRFIKADLSYPSSVRKIGSGYDYVYHLVAVNGTKFFYEMPHEVLRINMKSLINVLDWFIRRNRQGKILFTSSNEAYAGALDAFGKLPIPTPENVPLVISDVYNPRWSYAATKLIGEQFFIHYARKYGFRMSIVRPHNFYGPRAGYNHVIPEFITRIEKRTNPFPIYGADDTRSFCYITDAVKAMDMIMKSKKTDGEIYHIGSEEETRINDLAEKLFRISGWRPKKIEIHPSPKGSVKRRLADTAKIKNDIGWKPETGLEEGLKKTFEWYKKYYEGRI